MVTTKCRTKAATGHERKGASPPDDRLRVMASTPGDVQRFALGVHGTESAVFEIIEGPLPCPVCPHRKPPSMRTHGGLLGQQTAQRLRGCGAMRGHRVAVNSRANLALALN